LNVLAVTLSAIINGLKYVPELVDVGKDIWKHLKQPSQLAAPGAQNGIVGNTFYSGDYKFQISIPDDNWRFWKPTPQYIASLGTAYALPVRDVPILILSKNMIRLYRPMVTVTVEDVGSFTNIQELVEADKIWFQNEGYSIEDEGIKVSTSNNSAALIGTGKSYNKKPVLCGVEQIFLHACKGYYVFADYVPADPESPQLFGGMQDILNSFKLVK
jgi:hypothetical protein